MLSSNWVSRGIKVIEYIPRQWALSSEVFRDLERVSLSLGRVIRLLINALGMGC
jgi:hypothetical protein